VVRLSVLSFWTGSGSALDVSVAVTAGGSGVIEINPGEAFTAKVALTAGEGMSAMQAALRQTPYSGVPYFTAKSSAINPDNPPRWDPVVSLLILDDPLDPDTGDVGARPPTTRLSTEPPLAPRQPFSSRVTHPLHRALIRFNLLRWSSETWISFQRTSC